MTIGGSAIDTGTTLSGSPGAGIRRVLHVGRVGFVGGAENILLTAASGLQARGVKAFLACPDGPLRERADALGLVTIRLSLSRMQISANPLKLARYLRSWQNYSRQLVSLCQQHRIDLVHVHHPVTALYCSRIVKRLGLPLVFHLHEGPPGRVLYNVALKQAASLATRIICVSAAGTKLLELVGADRTRSIVIHNSVRDEFISRGRSLQESGERHGGQRIAVIGMIEKRKAQDIFIQAAAIVTKTHPNAEFHIIGDTPANDTSRYKAKLVKQIETLGLSKRVSISSYRNDIVECMLDQDLVVSCSTGLESLSLVVLEAMALGRVIVSSNIGGICEVVNDRENGFIVEPGSATSLAGGILYALGPSLVDVGRAAAEKAQSQFTTAEMCQRIHDVYVDIARRRSAA